MDCFFRIWNLVWNTLRRTQWAPLQVLLPVPTEMDRILNTLNELQERFRTSTGCSSRSALQEIVFQAPKKINDYVYEVCKPEGRPSVEIVFFHGLQLEHMSSKDAHVRTWISADKSEFWLNWLSQDFPDSRILTISYDAFPRRVDEEGMTEMHITRENLLHSFIGSDAEIGQDGCPVVLVGHCLGGLVMKELCVYANSILSLYRKDEPDERVANFLENVGGLFTYATPNQGSRLADNSTNFQKGPLFEDLKTLNAETARRNEHFRKLRQKYETWKISGVGESHPVTLGSFRGIVVPEASARHDVDGFITIAADHFNICKPVSRKCSSYQTLSSFITDVLKKDEARLPTKTGLFRGFEIVGVEASVDIIVKKLVRAPRLALVGIGGIGKTTLAKVVFQKISKNYDYVCFLDEVRSVMANQERPKDLRSKIIKGLKKGGRSVNSSSFNWSTLQRKKVLIVLDDAKFQSQVMVMTEGDGFSIESRVIVTSRESGFLQPLDFEIHRVDTLSLDDSKKLFCMHAFKESMEPRRFEERVTRFAEKCSGFPLALRVTGSYLYKRKEAVWDDAMEKLSRAQSLNGSKEDELWSILRMSYDSLAPSEQQMFLDAATCFHGKKLKDVQEAWRWCTWASASAESGWQNLLDRCLVSESSGNGRISMHEVLRDMGRAIAGHSRMAVDLRMREAKQLRNQEKATLKILIIDGGNRPWSYYSRTSEECNVVLSGLEKLEILWLRNVNLSCMELQLQALRQLKVEDCWTSQSRIPLLENFGLGQLQALESLEIIQVHLSESVNELSNDLIELSESVGELEALRSLHIYSCDSLTGLPESVGQLSALQSLEIIDSWSFTTLPNSLRELQALKLLHIGSHKLTALPESISQLRALQLLVIWCDSLEAVPNNLGQLQALEELEFQDCDELTRLPECIGQLRSLKRLKISGCSSLEGLPNTLGKLRALEKLSIDFCGKFTIVPECVGQLWALRQLSISSCESLKVLPKSLGELQALRKLVIRGCGELAMLPESIGQLRALEKLCIEDCCNLETFPITLGHFPALEELVIRDSLQLIVSPKSIGQLRALRRLEITHRNHSMIFPESVCQLRALRPLEITHENHFIAYPNQLRRREVLETLPNTLRQLHNLEKVTIDPEFRNLYRRTLPKSVRMGAGRFDTVVFPARRVPGRSKSGVSKTWLTTSSTSYT